MGKDFFLRKNGVIACAKEKRDERVQECMECDYAAKRERNLKRHLETHMSPSEKHAEARHGLEEDLGTEPGGLYELIGVFPAKAEKTCPGPPILERRSLINALHFHPSRRFSRLSVVQQRKLQIRVHQNRTFPLQQW